MEKNLRVENELLDLQSNMRHFAYSLTLNKDDAEDLLQDTTLKVLDNQDKFAENVNFKGWVLTIMKNIFINNYRKIVRNQTIIDKTEDFHLLNLPQDPKRSHYKRLLCPLHWHLLSHLHKHEHP